MIVKAWPNFYYSISSLALQIFRAHLNPYSIKFEVQLELDEKIRKAYIGGRCEVFGNPYEFNEKITHFDFKNMYGRVMQEDFPTGDLQLVNNPAKVEKPGFY